jgi:hypothetical protein
VCAAGVSGHSAQRPSTRNWKAYVPGGRHARSVWSLHTSPAGWRSGSSSLHDVKSPATRTSRPPSALVGQRNSTVACTILREQTGQSAAAAGPTSAGRTE